MFKETKKYSSRRIWVLPICDLKIITANFRGETGAHNLFVLGRVRGEGTEQQVILVSHFKYSLQDFTYTC